MKRSLTLFFFILWIVSPQPSLYSEIIELPTFSQIHPYLTKDSLIIFDIDDTLLVPQQMLGCDEWFQHRLNTYRLQGLSHTQALQQSLIEWEAVRHLSNMEIVEPGTEILIRQLQEQSYCMIGLTTQSLTLTIRTLQHLAENEINLSVTAPSSQDCYFENGTHGVLYHQGILFTSGTSKGEALFTFCERIGYHPSRVVFINDKATHLADVESSAQKRGVPFIGLRYAYSDTRKAAFNKEIADFQFSNSTLHHLLSDEEALLLMTY